MGLLDGAFSTGDPTGDLGLIGGLLSMRMGQGGPAPLLMQAAAMKMQQQNQERQNRASDLQQLTGAYSLLKQQEFAKMLAAKQAGRPYMPNPMLPQMEAKLAELTGLGNLGGKLTPAAAAPPMQMPAPQAMPQAAPGMAPQSQAVMANPGYQPSPQAVQQRVQQPQAPQVPQQDGSGLGGPAGDIPMEAWLAQDPTGKSYMEQLAKDNQPIVLRQGDLVKKTTDGRYVSAYQQPSTVPGVLPTRDPNGQVIAFREGPGFGQAAANIKGAEVGATKKAEAPYSFQNVTTASGAQVPMSIQSLMSGAVGRVQPPQQSQQLQQPQSQPNVARLTVTEPSRQSQIPQPQSQIPQPQSDAFSDIPRIPEASGLGQSTYQAGLAKLRADTASRLAETYGNNADAANKRIALNNQALSLLDRADTGFGAATLGDVKNVLVSRFGIPEGDFTNDPAATEALNKDLMNAATQKAKQQFGSRMTQSEVMMMLRRGAPNVDLMKSAIKFLIQTDSTQAQYDIGQSHHFGEYLGRGGDPLQFQSYYARKFPLSQVEEGITLPKAGATMKFDKNGNRVQ